jgi:hypothetical protein
VLITDCGSARALLESAPGRIAAGVETA